MRDLVLKVSPETHQRIMTQCRYAGMTVQQWFVVNLLEFLNHNVNRLTFPKVENKISKYLDVKMEKWVKDKVDEAAKSYQLSTNSFVVGMVLQQLERMKPGS